MNEVAAGLILFREGSNGREYLIIKNRRGGHWGFPKGHVEPGEDLMATALREVAEEVNIVSLYPIPGFTTSVHYSFPRGSQIVQKDVTLFLARSAEDGRPSKEEVAQMAWLPFPKALTRITFPEQRRALEEAETWLNSNPPRNP